MQVVGRRGFAYVIVLIALAASLPVTAQEGTDAAVEYDDVARPIDAVDIAVVPPDGDLTIGDAIPVTFDFSLPPSIIFDSADFRDAGHLQLLSRQIDETPLDDGGTDVHIELNLVSYRPGHHRIDHFVVGLLGPDGVVRDRILPGMEIRVTGLLANENDPEPRGEKLGVAVEYWNYTLAWVLGMGGGGLLMGLIGFLIAYTRPRPPVEMQQPPPRPAHEVALEKLDQIRADNLLEKGLYMEYYVRLSEAVREYLGGRYGFDGLDRTTEEMLRQMAHANLPTSLGEQFLTHLLYECDLVKFAKYAPGSIDQEEALRSAYRLVHETTDEADIAAAADEEPVADEKSATENENAQAGPADIEADANETEATGEQ